MQIQSYRNSPNAFNTPQRVAYLPTRLQSEFASSASEVQFGKGGKLAAFVSLIAFLWFAQAHPPSSGGKWIGKNPETGKFTVKVHEFGDSLWAAGGRLFSSRSGNDDCISTDLSQAVKAYQKERVLTPIISGKQQDAVQNMEDEMTRLGSPCPAADAIQGALESNFYTKETGKNNHWNFKAKPGEPYTEVNKPDYDPDNPEANADGYVVMNRFRNFETRRESNEAKIARWGKAKPFKTVGQALENIAGSGYGGHDKRGYAVKLVDLGGRLGYDMCTPCLVEKNGKIEKLDPEEE